MDPGLCHGIKANTTGYLCFKYECFLIGGCQDVDFNSVTGTRKIGLTAIALGT